MDYQIVTAKDWPTIADNNEEFTGIEFVEVDFTETPLKGLIFLDCKFSSCNFANTSIQNTVFRGVLFENCNMMGINWTDARKGGDFNFVGCKLDFGCFQSVDLRGRRFEDCSIKEADFSQANLAKSMFSGSVLSGASFTGANLEKCDFRSAQRYQIDPRYTKMKEAKFSFPEAITLLHALGIDIEM